MSRTKDKNILTKTQKGNILRIKVIYYLFAQKQNGVSV